MERVGGVGQDEEGGWLMGVVKCGVVMLERWLDDVRI